MRVAEVSMKELWVSMLVLSGSSDHGKFQSGPVTLYIGSAAIWSAIDIPVPSTRPKTVKPPFWESRLAELSARLMNQPLVALLG